MKTLLLKTSYLLTAICPLILGYSGTSSLETDSSTQVVSVTPSANPVVAHGLDAFLFADFIYWSAHMNNLDYLQTGLSSVNSINTAPINNSYVSGVGRSIAPHGKMSPGFKVGLGINYNHDGWDNIFRYTWLRPRSSSTPHLPSGANNLWGFAAVSEFQDKTTIVTQCNDSWSLDFNAIDAELGRNFFISENLLLRPHFGLKGSWQQQLVHFNFGSLSQIGTDSTITGSYHIAHDQYFWGLGVRAGLDTSWQINRNWGLFGDVAVTSMWSSFKDKRTDTATSDAATALTNATVLNTAQQLHSVKPVLELTLGVRYDYWFSHDDYRIRLQAGWEEQVWFNQNQFIRAYTPSVYGDLSLQGLTLEARLDF